MPRSTNGLTSHRRHRKVISRAKGYRGRRKNVFRVANQAVIKASQYAYRDRRNRKRDMRALWITRINAGRTAGGTYLPHFHARPESGFYPA